MKHDIISVLHPVNLFPPVAARTDNTAIVSSIIDTSGYNACGLFINLGTNADINSTFAVLVEDGDAANLSDAAAVDDKYLNGTEILAAFTAANDDTKCRKIGYVGPKRYVRVTITPSGNDSGNIFLSGIAILGEPSVSPTPNPPQ